jgi:hypothetical protein
MQDFVLIFRLTRALSNADRAELTDQTRGWAGKYNNAGHLLEPRMLGSDQGVLGTSGDALCGSIPLTALLFLKARDRDEAMSIAAGHPGLQYGASIEVRDWSGPERPFGNATSRTEEVSQ